MFDSRLPRKSTDAEVKPNNGVEDIGASAPNPQRCRVRPAWRTTYGVKVPLT